MGKEKDLDFDCIHCEHYFSFVSGEKHCSQKEKELTELKPCLDFKMRQVQLNEICLLMLNMMFGSNINIDIMNKSNSVLEKAFDKNISETEFENAVCELSENLTIDKEMIRQAVNASKEKL